MIEEQATVVRSDAQGVWIALQRQSACGQCSVRGGCGTTVLGKVMGQRMSRVRAVSGLKVEAGDRVIVGLDERALVKGSLAVYMVPLLLLIVFALIGRWLFDNNEPFIILSGLSGLVAGFVWLGRFSCRNIGNKEYQPVILRKITA